MGFFGGVAIENCILGIYPFASTVAGGFVEQRTVASSSVKRLKKSVTIATSPALVYETALSNVLFMRFWVCVLLLFGSILALYR